METSDAPKPVIPVEKKDLDRFLAKCDLDIETGCWVWTAASDEDGYGWFRYNHVSSRSHRWAHEVWNGPIEDGLAVHHRCTNRSCVNPAHLEAITPSLNVAESNGRRAIPIHPGKSLFPEYAK